MIVSEKRLQREITADTMTKRTLSLVIVLLGCFVTMAAAVETVRVDSSGAAPRLLVDGKPVRARMFWGAPGSGLIRIGPQGERITFEFSPNEDEPSRATTHFRFGATPGTIRLDDVHVVEIETGQEVIPQQKYEQGMDDFNRRWTFWPPGKQNTVGTIQVKRGCGADRSGGLQVDLKARRTAGGPTSTFITIQGWDCEKGAGTVSAFGLGPNRRGT